MPDLDPSVFNVSSAGTKISLDSQYQDEPVYRTQRVLGPTYRRGLFPAAMVSIFLSTASVLTDPRVLCQIDSSSIITRQRYGRRRISLAEARQRALRTLWLCERRRTDFAEEEARKFQVLYGWES